MNSLLTYRLFVALLHSTLLVLVLAAASCSKKQAEPQRGADSSVRADKDIVTLTKENLQNVNLKVEPVVLGRIETTVQAAGTVSVNLNRTAKVVTTLEGRLVRMNLDLNDEVREGEVIALVETPELLGRSLELKAPIGGVIIERKAVVGELVGKDTEICTISNPFDLWVIAQLKERDIGLIQVGQDAIFTVLAYPDERFSGKLVRIGEQVQSDSRTVEARIETKNADRKLKAGMFADVEITTSISANVLVIPESALQTDEGHQIVFVALDRNRFQKRVVRTGLQHGGRVQVLSGIRAGEKVATDGSFILKSQMLKGELGEKD